MNVADIIKGGKDLTGAEIETVYSKVNATYAVYRTAERVMVQYADEERLGAEQRLALSPLNPIRGEINGLIDVVGAPAPRATNKRRLSCLTVGSPML